MEEDAENGGVAALDTLLAGIKTDYADGMFAGPEKLPFADKAQLPKGMAKMAEVRCAQCQGATLCCVAVTCHTLLLLLGHHLQV